MKAKRSVVPAPALESSGFQVLRCIRDRCVVRVQVMSCVEMQVPGHAAVSLECKLMQR